LQEVWCLSVVFTDLHWTLLFGTVGMQTLQPCVHVLSASDVAIVYLQTAGSDELRAIEVREQSVASKLRDIEAREQEIVLKLKAVADRATLHNALAASEVPALT
jgi:hypothetical protein